MSDGPKRRLAAIVSADVVGYSRLMGADETATLAAMRAHRAELIDVKIAEHGERLQPRTVYVAPQDRHLGTSTTGRVDLSDDDVRSAVAYMIDAVN